MNEQLAPDAVTLHSASHLCFVVVRGADAAEVERHLFTAEEWLMSHLGDQQDC
ncbi:hypothetical protein [Streptomyces sp. MBT27]|uniref:hypothetical protein n=1 Tax=Streptomyces sp. MBT27 TaxID=1488356 RepID=UPI001F0770B2|nr:hypothetical protein [Streptomyces sp. MBT27]